ncbi:unnamed protein product [Ectocarpus sp. 12 AP-2014]
MRKRLELEANGGKVVWASDATVADLRPVLGERQDVYSHTLFLVLGLMSSVILVTSIRNE